MAQLRHAYQEIARRQAEVVVVGTDRPDQFERRWRELELPFRGVSDPTRSILRAYGQQASLARLGRLPATVLIDADWVVRWVHYGGSMMDVPPTAAILDQLDRLPPISADSKNDSTSEA